MESTLNQKSPVLVEAQLRFGWDQIQPHINQSIREIQKYVAIPGFRKGKVPRAHIAKRFRSEINRDLLQQMLPDGIEGLVKEHNIVPVMQPRVKTFNLKDNEGFEVEIELDVIEQFSLGAWQGLELEALKVQLEDDAVDAALERQQKESGDMQVITDRGAEDGDMVTTSLTAIDQESGDSVLDLEHMHFHMGGPKAHPFLNEFLAGANAGDTLETDYEAPEDDQFEDFRGKNLKLYMDIDKIERENIPVLDDAFAKGKGFESLDALKAFTREDLLKQAEAREQSRREQVLLERLVAQHPFQVPDGIIREQANALARYELQGLERYMASGNIDQELFKHYFEGIQGRAAFMVRSDILIDKLFEAMALSVEDADVDQFIKDEMGITEDAELLKTREDLEKQNIMSGLLSQLRRKKVLAKVLEAAKMTEVDSLTQPEPQQEEAEAQKAKEADASSPQETGSSEGA